MTTFDGSGGPPILGDEGAAPGTDDGAANILRCVFGEASSDSDEVTACSMREGGDGVTVAREECPGIGIGGDDDCVEPVPGAAAAEASCASLAPRIAATHALASCCDSAWR